MLNSITLENFKKHKKLHIDFKNGVNVILGSNYTGKSTVLEAIAFAFGGVQAVNVNASSLNNTDGGKLKVIVNFESNGKDWILMRSDTSASLHSDSGDSATGKTGVNSLLDDIIGLDRKLFHILRYSKQGEASHLLSEGETKLTKMIEELSGVDLMDQVLGNLRVMKAQLTAQINGLGFARDLSDEDLEIMKAELQEDCAILAEDLDKQESIKMRIGKSRNKKAAIKEVLSELQKKQREYTRNDSKKQRLNGKLETLNKNIRSLEAAISETNNLHDEYAHLPGQLMVKEQIVSNVKNLESVISSASESIKELEDDIESIDEGIALIGERNEQLSKRTSVLQSPEAAKVLRDKHSELREEFHKFEDIVNSGVCPECHRPYDNQDEAVADAQGQMDKVAKQMTYMEDLYLDAQQEATEYENATELMAKNTAKQAAMEGKKEVTVNLLNDIRAELKEAELQLRDKGDVPTRSEMKELANKVDFWRRRIAQLESDTSNLARLNQEVKETKTELRNMPELIPVSDEEITLVENDLSEIEHSLSDYLSRNEVLITSVSALKAKVNSTELKLKEISEVREELLLVEADLDKNKRLTKFLRDNRSSLINNLWESILAQASTVTSMITGGAIDRVMKTEDLGMCYSEGGVLLPVASGSGCQRAVMGVAIRSAISSTFSSNLKFMLFDEITADMDEEHASATMSVLPKLNDQIVYITHRSSDLRDSYHTTEL